MISVSHIILKCPSATPKRQEILQYTKYLFHKYFWKQQFLEQQQFFHGNEIITKIQQLQQQLLSDPKFEPIKVLIQDPFSLQALNLLQRYNINLDSVLYPYWNAHITTFMERTDYIKPIRTLIYSLEYKILYEHQFMYHIWSFIQYPNTLSQLESLFEVIMDGVKKKHFHRLFSFELHHVPYIVKIFIYIYLAIAAQTLL